MKACRQFSQWIWLDIYNELLPDQQKQLKDHLEACVECRLDYQEAKQTVKMLDQKVQLEPTELELKANRAELHQQLMFLRYNRHSRKWLDKIWQVVSLDFTPGLRLSTALAMLIIGIVLGRFLIAPGKVKSIEQLSPLATNSNVVGLESLEYNPQTKEVTLKLNTVNENIIRGDLEKPIIQQMLAQTLITDDRPNVRLKTVGALSFIKTFDQQLLSALIHVLENDDNPGVRLKAAKLLNSVPINSYVKDLLINVFVKVLLNEDNPAIRNEAINGLGRISDNEIAPIIFKAAEKDTNEYVRYKANQLITRTKLERTDNGSK